MCCNLCLALLIETCGWFGIFFFWCLTSTCTVTSTRHYVQCQVTSLGAIPTQWRCLLYPMIISVCEIKHKWYVHNSYRFGIYLAAGSFPIVLPSSGIISQLTSDKWQSLRSVEASNADVLLGPHCFPETQVHLRDVSCQLATLPSFNNI